MRRFVVALVCVVLCGMFAAEVRADVDSVSLTLAVSNANPVVGGTVTFTGTVSPAIDFSSFGYDLVLTAYDGPTCVGTRIWTRMIGGYPPPLWWDIGHLVFDPQGFHAVDFPPEPGRIAFPYRSEPGGFAFRVGVDRPGAASFNAEAYSFLTQFATSNCVELDVPAPPEPLSQGSSSFLCWNHEMVDPVAYLDSDAIQMWATGRYLTPQAIAGRVDGGTNIGEYHLVCNAPATMHDTGYGLGGSGEVYAPEVRAAYDRSQAGAGIDLNVYRIYA